MFEIPCPLEPNKALQRFPAVGADVFLVRSGSEGVNDVPTRANVLCSSDRGTRSRRLDPDREFDISSWIDELGAQGYRISDVAAGALRSYGGLEVGLINTGGPDFSNDEALNVDPILAGSGHHAFAEELIRELGGEWYPLGEWLSSSSVLFGGSFCRC